MKAAKMNPAVQDGREVGAKLADSAADILLRQFSNRPVTTESRASKQWVYAWDLLRAALGSMADHDEVAAALAELDNAHGEALVEQEDRAWHAAWTAAMGLRGGGR